MGESILRDREAPFQGRDVRRLSKGNPVKIPEPGVGRAATRVSLGTLAGAPGRVFFSF
jgi:hypothetical protein